MSDVANADQKFSLFPLPTPVFSRAPKQSYDGIDAGRPLVIDNGSFYFRCGWAGEDDPRLIFRNHIFRPRDKVNGSVVTVVGDWGLGIKGYDNPRPAGRDAFDGGVVCNFETQEYVLDYAFERLSIQGSSVRHPVLITEAPLAPNPCRAGMAELLFEAYGIPSLQFAIDSVCAYLYCTKKGRCSGSGLVVGSGHSATHVIPMLHGKPVLEHCNRMRPCGSLATDHMARTLAVKHPQHMVAFNATSGQLLKEQFSYASPDYRQELAEMQQSQSKAESQGLMIQLPWKPDKVQSKEEAEAEAARKAARLENNRQRLKDMAEQRKNKSIQEKEGYLTYLQHVAQQVEETDSQEEASALLAQAGMNQVKELEKAIQDTQASLRRLRGEEPKATSSTAKEEQSFDLVDIPDAELSPNRLKEKRKQKMMKGARDARALRKQAAEQAREVARRRAEMEEERVKNDPTAYLEHIKQQHKAVAERIQARKRRHAGIAAPDMAAGKRTSADQRSRMRLIAQAAFDKGNKEGDDDFGRDDKDWEVYKQMDRNFSDSDEAAEDERVYNRTASRLEELGAKLEVVEVNGGGELPGGQQQQAPLTAEDYQVWLGIERLHGAELLFQPSLAGIEQAGLTEVIVNILRRLPADWSDACASGGVLLTGGNCSYPGLEKRLFSELQSCRPFDHPMQVVRSFDCLLDAWRGASMLARKSSFFKSGISKADYEENGPHYLGLYKGPGEFLL